MKKLFFALIFLFSSSSSFADYNREDSLAAARAVCYSALNGGNFSKSVILIPLQSNLVDLDGACHTEIDRSWHAGGVVKGNFWNQVCTSLDNQQFGGSYTSYVREDYFESNRSTFFNCGPDTAYICCSPSFPN